MEAEEGEMQEPEPAEQGEQEREEGQEDDDAGSEEGELIEEPPPLGGPAFGSEVFVGGKCCFCLCVFNRSICHFSLIDWPDLFPTYQWSDRPGVLPFQSIDRLFVCVFNPSKSLFFFK